VVHGDGTSFWVACHRDDVAHSSVAAAGQPHTFGKAYHTAGEEWLTWNQYHEQVAEAIGAPRPTLVHIPSDALAQLAPQRAEITVTNLQFNNIFDNHAARADLDFQYTTSWMSGVRRMVAWLDEHGKIEDSDTDPFENRLIERWQQAIGQAGQEG
jgi:nucleoside-diphosphate-sugar epimerase